MFLLADVTAGALGSYSPDGRLGYPRWGGRVRSNPILSYPALRYKFSILVPPELMGPFLDILLSVDLNCSVLNPSLRISDCIMRELGTWLWFSRIQLILTGIDHFIKLEFNWRIWTEKSVDLNNIIFISTLNYETRIIS